MPVDINCMEPTQTDYKTLTSVRDYKYHAVYQRHSLLFKALHQTISITYVCEAGNSSNIQPGERTRCETFVYLLMERLAPGPGPPINQTNPSLPLCVEAWWKTWQREFVSTSGNVSNKAGRQPWSPTGVFLQITIQVELVWLFDWLGCEVLCGGGVELY